MIFRYFIFLLPFFFCSAQVKSKLTIQYKLYCAPRDVASQAKFSSFGISNEAIVQNFNLFINDTISFFKPEDGIKNEELNHEFCLSGAFCNTPIYYIKNKNVLYKPTFLEGMFPSDLYLISKNAVNNWNITAESKIIDGKLCYKATCEDSYSHNKDKKVNFEVTAWFCPEIPLQFGPSLYNNLPGLILEVSYLRFTLIANKISYSLDAKAIVKPKGKKIVDEDTFTILNSKRFSEYKSEIESELKKQAEKK